MVSACSAPPADAPDAIKVPTTILLMIDLESGALREVRELAGPEGGERSSRTTWRFVAGERADGGAGDRARVRAAAGVEWRWRF